MKKTDFPVDAVITWVDGNDKRHKAKCLKYGCDSIFNADDVGGNTRFASVGEIFYCIASIYRFAPWINKIYIVTDEQDPQVGDFLRKHFPEKYIPIEIIDHKSIFKGYEQYLPTFNSISIETMTWRIPGLSEHYIEFNDDFILTAPTVVNDFFTTDKYVVCYGKITGSALVRITRFLKRNKNGGRKVTFKECMLNAASLLGKKRFFIKFYHTPRALLKSVYSNFFNGHNELLTSNISYRFRNHKQFNPQEIQYILLHDQKRCVFKRAYDNLLYIKPKKDIGYTLRKLEEFDKRPSAKFGCINSLDQASEQAQKTIIKWIEKRIGLNP